MSLMEGARMFDPRKGGKVRSVAMHPATTIIAKFGGEEEVAKILGLRTANVYLWQRSLEKHGTCGVIPQKHVLKLIRAANERGIELRVEHFFEEPREITLNTETSSDRAERRRILSVERSRKFRRDNGAVSRDGYEENSISRLKPWETLGMSRASFYRLAEEKRNEVLQTLRAQGGGRK